MFPFLDSCGKMQFWRFLGTFAGYNLFEVGRHGHVHVDVEPFELILTPGNKATVLRLYHILRRKELAFETCLRIDDFEIL